MILFGQVRHLLSGKLSEMYTGTLRSDFATLWEYHYFKNKRVETEEESPLRSRTAWVRILATPLSSQWDTAYVTIPCLSFFPCKMGVIIVVYLLELKSVNIRPYNFTNSATSVSLAML